jgi:hypothetical protein
MRRWFGKAKPAKNCSIAESDRQASPDNIVKLKRVLAISPPAVTFSGRAK